MNHQANKEKELFAEALERPAGERAAFLEQACGTGSELIQQVQELLDAYSAGPPALKTALLAEPPLDKISERPGSTIGRYKLLQKIGEGGMGVVYMAEQEEPVRRRVALKIIKLGMDTRQVVARFEAERQALALMDHPNIARVLDGGATETGRPYFVMELVQGVPITEFCDRNKLPPPDRLKLFIQVCQAIQSAHQKGIIHRDIKPSNVLVTLHHGEPMPKVIDFGIAKATNRKLTEKTLFTQYATMVGTPAYMSPEQAEMSSLDVDTRTDIYALGVLLYELLTGTTPFPEMRLRSLGYGEMQRVIVEEEPERPSTRLSTMANEQKSALATTHGQDFAALNKLLRGDLDWIVMKCLEKDRTRRYETANGLAADLKRHLNNEPVTARPPSTAYRFQKAWRRNKLVFTAATAVVATLLFGVIVSTWQATVATRAKNQATRAEAGKAEEARKAEAERDNAKAAEAQAQTARKLAETAQRQSRRLLYAADMNLAQQSLKLNNLGRARRLLERHRPQQPREEDLRGWEWRYLWQLTRGSALVTLTNRPATRGFSVSFSPDGTRLAVGWYDGHVDLWDVPSRRWIRALTDGERPHSGRVAFSPVRNLLAATSKPNLVTLYDLDSGRESTLWRAPDPAEWDVRDLIFSRDGSRLVIYAGSNPECEDAVWVMNVSSFQVESRQPAGCSDNDYTHIGSARLSPDNRRLYLALSDYLNGRYGIQCIDLNTGQELWQKEWQRDRGVSALDISPDGRVLASASAFTDTMIHIWDASTGELLEQLHGHTAWISELAFTRDGRRLISAAADQTIRFWDTSAWTETQVLRGHTDEVWTIAISDPAQLIASASKDGGLMLWTRDGTRAADGYRRLPENLGRDDVQPLDHSRVLFLPPGQPPELFDLKSNAPPLPLPEIGPSANVLGCFGTNLLCHWDGTNRIIVSELRGARFVQQGAIALDSGMRPAGFAYNPARQLLAWTEGTSSTTLYLASLVAPGRRIELRSDVPGLVPFGFSGDGTYLAATREQDTLRAWNIKARQIVAAINQNFTDACFAANGRVLVVALRDRTRNETGFYDLVRPHRLPQRVTGGFFKSALAVSPNGELVAASSQDGQMRLFDPAMGELIDSLHGHLNAAISIAFSPDGRRLISTYGGQEAVKLWDVGTRQELLTLAGIDSNLYAARWSADGDVILAGARWQAWRAPSWEEIYAAEAQQRAEARQP